ncbi:MAG: hypothetical protein WDN00_14920 [Limisphaerales bacterium]
MGLPFLSGLGRKKRTRILSIDLGERITKAVLLEQRGEVLALSRATGCTDLRQKNFTEQLAEHLKAVLKALDVKDKSVTLSVGLDDALLRQVDLPQIPVEEMRLVLKNNTKAYLQQDLPGHVYDCHIFPPRPSGDKSEETSKSPSLPKLKVLVAAARQTLVNDFQTAFKSAGLVGDHIVPGFVGGVNAFEMAWPEIFKMNRWHCGHRVQAHFDLRAGLWRDRFDARGQHRRGSIYDGTGRDDEHFLRGGGEHQGQHGAGNPVCA